MKQKLWRKFEELCCGGLKKQTNKQVNVDGVYLRQGLHDRVQQSSHTHCHLQQLQHC